MKRAIIIILAILVAVAAGVYLYLRYNKLNDFEPLLKERLNKLVMDASHGLYRLEIESLKTDVIEGEITIINAHLRPDTTVYAAMEKSKQAPNDLFEVFVSQLAVDNIDPQQLLTNKEIVLHRLFVNQPVVNVWHKKQPYNITSEDSLQNIFQQIRNDINSIRVDTVILQNIDFNYTNRSQNNRKARLSGMKLSLTDLLIDSSTQFDKQRFLYARNCLISVKDYSLNTSDSLYRLKVGEIQIETMQQKMQLTSTVFEPRLSEKSFYKKIGHQQDRFALSIGTVNFSAIDWWALLAEESFVAEKITLRNGSIKVYNDKSMPLDPRSKVGKYPHQLLMKVPLRLKVDSLSIADLDLSYTELNPKSGKTGTLRFENVQANVGNLTNIPEAIRANAFCRIRASAQFMKKASLQAEFNLDLANAAKGNFTVNASLGNMNGQDLNAITVPLALLQVNKLQIQGLTASMRCTNYSSTGTVKLLYSDLNVTALKSDEDALKKRGLLSFIANTFILKKANPLNDKPVRVEKVTYKRDTQKSFFNLVWKTIFTGIVKTAGYNKK